MHFQQRKYATKWTIETVKLFYIHVFSDVSQVKYDDCFLWYYILLKVVLAIKIFVAIFHQHLAVLFRSRVFRVFFQIQSKCVVDQELKTSALTYYSHTTHHKLQQHLDSHTKISCITQVSHQHTSITQETLNFNSGHILLNKWDTGWTPTAPIMGQLCPTTHQLSHDNSRSTMQWIQQLIHTNFHITRSMQSHQLEMRKVTTSRITSLCFQFIYSCQKANIR